MKTPSSDIHNYKFMPSLPVIFTRNLFKQKIGNSNIKAENSNFKV